MKTTKKRSPAKPMPLARTKTVRSRSASDDEAGLPPPYPAPNAAGMVNALAYVRSSIAHELVEARRRAGLSQQQLADLAKVRQETISRIESAKHTVTPRVLNKLMRALTKAPRRKASA
jgi:ribosome-binding protein aMBF1 (putative translation factor)